MQTMFNIAVVIAIIVLIVKLFMRSIAKDLDHSQKLSLFRLLLIGATFKIGLILLWYAWVGGLEINPSVSDIYFYDYTGRMLADNFRKGMFFTLPTVVENSYPGYPYFLGITYSLFGHSYMMASILNALCSVLLAILMYHIADSIFGHRIAKFTFTLNLFYPQFVSASYYLLKDMLVTFLTVGIAWSIYTYRDRKILQLIMSIFFITIMLFFRLSQAMIVLIIAVISLFLLRLDKKPRRIWSISSPLLIMLIIVFIFNIWQGGNISNIGMITSVPVSEEVKGWLGTVRLEFNFSTFGKIWNIIAVNPFIFAISAAETIVRTFYGPFYLYARVGPTLKPYYFTESGFRAILETFSGLMIGFLMPMVSWGLLHCIKKKRRESFFLYTLIVVWCFILIFVGNMYRWRLPMMPFVLTLAAIGISRFPRKFKQLYTLYICLYISFIALNASAGALLEPLGLTFLVLFVFLSASFLKKKYRLWI